MKISFHGAAREVTGSCHLVETSGSRLLLDCGMIQGGDERHDRNRAPFGFDAAAVDAVLLSHAHLDHSGRLPLLVRRGFRGKIFATEPTADLVRILLADSGRIQEEDARFKARRLEKAGEDGSWVRPLYTEEDAAAVLERIVAVPFDAAQDVSGNARVRFVPAGHILGAAIVELEVRDRGTDRRVVFSGDLGVPGARLLGEPQRVDCPHALVIESTYGDRARGESRDRTEALLDVVSRTADRGGRVLVPAFAVGRTQEILARLNDLVEAGRLRGVPVYVDSPMAIEATAVFARHPEAYSETARRARRAGDEPLAFEGLRFTRTVAESRSIDAERRPCVVISASGMCTAGRIKHHLAHRLGDPRNTVLMVGYQARGTLGRALQDGTSPVRIFGEWHRVEAEIATIAGFSAHADRDELLAWFDAVGGPPARTFVVHGEEAAAESLAAALRHRSGADVTVPELGEAFDLD